MLLNPRYYVANTCKEPVIFRSSWTYDVGAFGLVSCLVLFGHYFLDTRLSSLVAEIMGSDFLLSRHVSEMPDLLLLMVCIVTVFGWGCHLHIMRTRSSILKPDFFHVIGCSVPLAFALKGILKFIFGKTNTRLWLMAPRLYGMHWFNGGGNFSAFPSGHMAVFTALMVAISRYFPQYRFLCRGFLLLSAAALIATEYHFFSDVVAGVYLGLIVDRVTHKVLSV